MNMKVIEGRSRGVRVLKTEAAAISSPRGRGVGSAVLLSAIVAALVGMITSMVLLLGARTQPGGGTER
jgi:hypothetical protein